MNQGVDNFVMNDYNLPGDDEEEEEYYQEQFEEDNEPLDINNQLAMQRNLQQTHPPLRNPNEHAVFLKDYSEPLQKQDDNAYQFQMNPSDSNWSKYQQQVPNPHQIIPPSFQPVSSHPIKIQGNAPPYPNHSNMNWHQHFNSPNIVNFTQNAFYQQSPYNQHQLPPAPHFPHMKQSNKNTLKSDEQSTISNRKRRPTSAVNSGMKQGEGSAKNIGMNFAQKKQASVNDYFNDNFRRKIIPQQMIYDKEDLYDQNMVLKINANEWREELVRMKTRLNILQQQLKGKDTLIDELYKSAYITAAGTQAKSNLKKEVLMVIKLKRKVYELKDVLNQKEFEISDLNKMLKSTKMKELQVEARSYMQECVRLRQLCEHAVKMSGEIDLDKIRQQTADYTNQMNEKFQMQQKYLEQLEEEAKKAENSFQQVQLDLKNAQQKIGECQDEIQVLNSDKAQLNFQLSKLYEEKAQGETNFKGIIKGKEREMEALGENISELEGQLYLKEEELTEVKKKIPKKPEEEYIEEVDQKNTKIEELMDELLQKDTLIDQQAVLNKNMQKKCDQQAEDIKQFVENQNMYQGQIKTLKEQLNDQIQINQQQQSQINQQQESAGDLNQQIEMLKQKNSEMRQEHEVRMLEVQGRFDNEKQNLNSQLSEMQGYNIDLRDELEKVKQLLREQEKENEELKMQRNSIQEKLDKEEKRAPVVTEANEAVQEGFERIKSLCQVTGKLHDQIENLLFEEYLIEKKVSILDMQDILISKLKMEQDKALLFSRFLIEPADEGLIEVTLDRTVVSSKVIVKIMNKIGNIVLFYGEDVSQMEMIMATLFQKEEVQKAISLQIVISQKIITHDIFLSLFTSAELPELCLDQKILSTLFVEILKKNNEIYQIQTDQIIPQIQTYIKNHRHRSNLNLGYSASGLVGSPSEVKSSYRGEIPNFRASQEDSAIMDEVLPPNQQLKAIMLLNRANDDEGDDENQYDQEQLNAILEQAEFLLENLSNSFREIGTTMRLELKNFIYSIKHPKTEEEIEVIRLKDFLEIMGKKYPGVFEEDCDFIVEQIFAMKDADQNIPFLQLVKSMNSYGIHEQLPHPLKHLDYRDLSLKSQRILNRLSIFLAKEKKDIDEHFNEIVFSQMVKATNKEEKVDLIKAELFFKKLKKDGIIKKTEGKENLSLYLCIDEQFKRHLMIKKLKRTLNDIAGSQFLQMIGTKKKKLKDVEKKKAQFLKELEREEEEKKGQEKQQQQQLLNPYKSESDHLQEESKITQVPPRQLEEEKTVQVQGKLEQSETDNNEQDEEEELYGDEEQGEDEEEPEEETKDNMATTEGKDNFQKDLNDRSSEEDQGEGEGEEEEEEQEDQEDDKEKTGNKDASLDYGALESSLKNKDEGNQQENLDPYNPFPYQEEEDDEGGQVGQNQNKDEDEDDYF